ncbi:MAG: vitamin K epoxide reductase family protein [Candidatus Saccharimonadales bacterium]
MQKTLKKFVTFPNFVPWLLAIGGSIGTLASLMLTIEEFHFIKNPTAPLSCDINPIVGCGSAMSTWQGHVLLGIPNQLFGIAVFAAIATLGVVLINNIKLPKWMWQSLTAGLFGALLFVHWFIYQSIYVLERLCPYCMATWVAVIPMFWYTFLFALKSGYLTRLRIPAKAQDFMLRHHLDILMVWFLIIVGLIVQHFWYYFAG